MPNDAKLGMVLGIGLVMLIGMVFFRADPPARGGDPHPTASVNSAQVPAPTDPSP